MGEHGVPEHEFVSGCTRRFRLSLAAIRLPNRTRIYKYQIFPLQGTYRIYVGLASSARQSVEIVAYLDPDQESLYADQSAWDAMQGAVVTRLEALR
jgi:hypothetical protein